MQFRLLSLLLASVWAAQIASGVTPTPRTVSTTRQFIVYGGDVRLRGAMCDLGEHAKANLLTLLQQRDGWKTPILINLQEVRANLPETPTVALIFSQTGGGLKLQLDLAVGPAFSASGAEREVLRAILLEMMYRDQPGLAAGTSYVQPPGWLIDGLLSDNGANVLSDALQSILAANQIMPLPEFLAQRPELLDSPGRALFRAYAAALLRMLTESPNGRVALAKFITELPASSGDPVADLRAHFPALTAARGSMEKAWSLSVARLASAERYQALTISETEQQLEAALQLRIPTADATLKAFTLAQFPEFLRLPARGPVLAHAREEVLLLATRTNPAYLPIVQEYQQIIELLQRGKIKGIAERLAHVNSYRGTVVARMKAVDDYLNWYEATQSRTRSGAFTAYLKTAAEAAEPEARRRDPISAYIDTVEEQLGH